MNEKILNSPIIKYLTHLIECGDLKSESLPYSYLYNDEENYITIKDINISFDEQFDIKKFVFEIPDETVYDSVDINTLIDNTLLDLIKHHIEKDVIEDINYYAEYSYYQNLSYIEKIKHNLTTFLNKNISGYINIYKKEVKLRGLKIKNKLPFILSEARSKFASITKKNDKIVILTNTTIASYIQELPGFRYLGDYNFNGGFTPYTIGYFKDMVVIVDPYQDYFDNYLIITDCGCNDEYYTGMKLFFDETFTKLERLDNMKSINIKIKPIYLGDLKDSPHRFKKIYLDLA